MNCKPGDLAIVVATDFPGNLGRIVEVLRVSVDGPPEWECQGVNGALVGCYWDSGLMDATNPLIDIHDSDLRPIRPEPDPLERTTDREVTA